MIFNSFEYFLFLPLVFCLYWSVFSKSVRIQNLLILVASYVFYGWWDWRFLSLILLSTLVDYVIGSRLSQTEHLKIRHFLLGISMFFNLGLLGFFKYYNFFIESFVDLLSATGFQTESSWTLGVILPVGISFYTFQTMSYTIDVYRRKIEPPKDFIAFASFVSFFPQLVAGPIERATNLLPQMLKPRTFSYPLAVQGCRLILYGLFKKVCIGDMLAPKVDEIFSAYQTFDGGVLLLGAVYFAFQIYADFSGYSDIAIGTSLLFGFHLMSNFRFPYFSRDIAEFWRRWHISLSGWFRDYLYIPLGGSRVGKWHSLRNIFVIFLVSGFWHGANWTFIVWGGLHSLFYVPLFLAKKTHKFTSDVCAQGKCFPSLRETLGMFQTFTLVTLSWVFFRSPSVSDSLAYLGLMFSNLVIPMTHRAGILYCVVLFACDWLLRYDERLSTVRISHGVLRFSYIVLAVFVLDNLLKGQGSDFIYFQF